MSFTPLSTQSLEMPWVHVFMYGATGAGKTLAASTFPTPLFLVPGNEASFVTLRGLDHKYLEVDSRVKMDQIVTWLEHIQSTQGPDHLPCETIVIESLSHYIDLVIEDITQGGKRQMDMQGWGLVASHFRNLQSRLRRIQCHVIFTSLAEELTNDQGNVIGGRPLVTGQTRVKLPSSCDIITYLECREGKPPRYTAHFSTYRGFAARTRFSAIPASIDNLHYNKICAAFGGAPIPPTDTKGAAQISSPPS